MLALTVVYLVGHTAVLALIRRWEVGGREVTGRRLVGLNIGLNLLFSLPVLGLFVGMTFLVAPGTNAGFLVFAVLIALYAFFQGASDSPRESLDNAYIPARTQERASVLSLIEVLRKMIAAVVIFALGFVVNTSEAMLWAWAVLTVAVVALTLALPAASWGSTLHQRMGPETGRR